MNSELTNDQLGAIAKLIDKNRDDIPAEWVAGYDEKAAELNQPRTELAPTLAEVVVEERQRLTALGFTDAQIDAELWERGLID